MPKYWIWFLLVVCNLFWAGVFTAMISGILGERVTGAQGLGGLFVFCGVYLTTGMLEQNFNIGCRKNNFP